MIKKFLLSFAVVGTFLIYAIHQKSEGMTAVQNVVPPIISPTEPAQQTTELPTSGQGTPLPPTSVPVSRGQYKDGEFIGSVADAFYGNIQVKAIISGGKITDVQFLQYPSDRGTSIEINSQAMPYLTQEAISAQNASVDIVSGATQSSLAFRESLASALAQAK